jgi:hypothetical protein
MDVTADLAPRGRTGKDTDGTEPMTDSDRDGFYDSLTLGIPIPLDCLPLAFLRYEMEMAIAYLRERGAFLADKEPDA